jgi:deferrochelatase/peroxidase EfeB
MMKHLKPRKQCLLIKRVITFQFQGVPYLMSVLPSFLDTMQTWNDNKGLKKAYTDAMTAVAVSINQSQWDKMSKESLTKDGMREECQTMGD